MFDHVFAIDWSARSRPSPKKPSADSIFIAQKDTIETKEKILDLLLKLS